VIEINKSSNGHDSAVRLGKPSRPKASPDQAIERGDPRFILIDQVHCSGIPFELDILFERFSSYV
jgi:hypothetical protein